jgi:hypothetical protein
MGAQKFGGAGKQRRLQIVGVARFMVPHGRLAC